jgi:hypothetical protein
LNYSGQQHVPNISLFKPPHFAHAAFSYVSCACKKKHYFLTRYFLTGLFSGDAMCVFGGEKLLLLLLVVVVVVVVVVVGDVVVVVVVVVSNIGHQSVNKTLFCDMDLNVLCKIFA